MTTSPEAIARDYLNGPDWDLECLLGSTESVINMDHLNHMELKLERLIDRAKYYGEHTKALEILTELHTDIRFIKMGARP